jgi:hypothetical protein
VGEAGRGTPGQVKDEASQAGESEVSSTKYTFTTDELIRIVTYVEELNEIETSGVKVDSYSDQFLAVDGVPTPFSIRLDDDGTYNVSVVVSL